MGRERLISRRGTAVSQVAQRHLFLRPVSISHLAWKPIDNQNAEVFPLHQGSEHFSTAFMIKTNDWLGSGLCCIYCRIINGVLIPGKRVEKVNVYEIMTKPIMSVPADMDIRYIARLLHRVGMRRAPVKENGKPVGMVTLSALVLDNDLFLQ